MGASEWLPAYAVWILSVTALRSHSRLTERTSCTIRLEERVSTDGGSRSLKLSVSARTYVGHAIRLPIPYPRSIQNEEKSRP